MNIRRIIREALLSERMFNIDSDVDLIYNKYFKKDIDSTNSLKLVAGQMFSSNSTSTEIFQTESCQQAHEIFPCFININGGRNFYQPSKTLLSLSVNMDAVYFIKYECDGKLNLAKEKEPRIDKEFTESKLKGSIRHELIHWIDDALYNAHVDKLINKRIKQTKQGKVLNNINSVFTEINGQIGNIYEFKRNNEEVYDTLTFKELVSEVPTLKGVENALLNTPQVYNKWKRQLKTRMHREGLLGKNMR